MILGCADFDLAIAQSAYYPRWLTTYSLCSNHEVEESRGPVLDALLFVHGMDQGQTIMAERLTRGKKGALPSDRSGQ